jgi:hypothetical protein
MKTIVITILIILTPSAAALAQTGKDACHVYVVDVLKARKAVASFRETEDSKANAKALAAGQTVFPEFRPVIGEEELTTKTYPFPGSNLHITASVYYTDESMASAEGSDSMVVGIVVSPGPQRDAISAENNAVSEVTLNDHLDTVRAKKYMRVNGRRYLVGIECRCKERVGATISQRRHRFSKY